MCSRGDLFYRLAIRYGRRTPRSASLHVALKLCSPASPTQLEDTGDVGLPVRGPLEVAWYVVRKMFPLSRTLNSRRLPSIRCDQVLIDRTQIIINRCDRFHLKILFSDHLVE